MSTFFTSLFILFFFCLSIQSFFHKDSALQIPFSILQGSVEDWKADGDSIVGKAMEPRPSVEEVKYVDEGSGILGFSSLMGLLNSAKMEGSRRQPRSMLEHASVVDDETMDSQNIDPQDTIDYDPPHSTPPIHNH